MTVSLPVFYNPTLLVNHQDIAKLPPTVFPTVLKHLNLEEQCLIRRVSLAWAQTSDVIRSVSLRWTRSLHIKGDLFALIQAVVISKDKIMRLHDQGFRFPIVQEKFCAERNVVLGNYLSLAIQTQFKQNPLAMMDYLNNLSPNVRETIEYTDFSNTTINDPILLRVIQKCPNLKALDLRSTPIHGNSLTQLLNVNKLKTLNLSFGRVPNTANAFAFPQHDEEALKSLFSQATNIEELSLCCGTLSGNVFQRFNPSKLKKLELSYLNNLDEGFSLFLKNMHELEELTLYTSSSEILSLLNLPNLKKLTLRSMQGANEENLGKLLSTVSGLKQLNLSHMTITGPVFHNFNSLDLADLNLSQCVGIEEDTLQKLLSKAKTLKNIFIELLNMSGRVFQGFSSPDLKSLEIMEMEDLEDEDLQPVLSNAPSLYNLSILLAGKITEKAFLNFASSKLEYFCLIECGKINFNDPGFLSFFSNKRLTTLIVHGDNVSSALLQSVNPDRLKRLELSDCDMEKEVIQALLSNSPKLEDLVFTSTNITPGAFQGFASSSLKRFHLVDPDELDPGFFQESFRDFFRKNKSLEEVELHPTEIMEVYQSVRDELKGIARLELPEVMICDNC
ncbi:MAG: hypothetical protein PVI40_07255 [Chlamydiota bacterium]|jgi:hypothetical protein